MKTYPVQIVYRSDLCEVGHIVFMSSEYYHEDFAHILSQGFEDVFEVTPLEPIPEDY